MTYYLYLLQCQDQSLYSGITTNLTRRVAEHNNSNKGAKYTRARRPVKLIYSQEYPDRSSASIAEHKLKKLSHATKMQVAIKESKV